jgi:hypothetical protein
MNNELLRLVHKTNNVEKNENKQQTDTHKWIWIFFVIKII